MLKLVFAVTFAVEAYAEYEQESLNPETEIFLSFSGTTNCFVFQKDLKEQTFM